MVANDFVACAIGHMVTVAQIDAGLRLGSLSVPQRQLAAFTEGHFARQKDCGYAMPIQALLTRCIWQQLKKAVPDTRYVSLLQCSRAWSFG